MTAASAVDYQVFVLSCHRAELLAAALRAILAAGCPPERLTVSDNSTDDAARAVVAEFPGVGFVARRPPLPLLDHFNTVIRSATAEYFFMLHDDDLVLPNFFADSLDLIGRHPTAGAATLNARFLDGETLGELCCPAIFEEREVRGGEAYLRTIFTLRPTSFPFPGHVYRTARVATLDARLEGAGQYSDVVFLLQLAHRWGLAQSTNVGLHYRRHHQQGSANASVYRTREIFAWARQRGIDVTAETEVRLFRLNTMQWLLRFRGWYRLRRRFQIGFLLLLLRSPAHYAHALRSWTGRLTRAVGRRGRSS